MLSPYLSNGSLNFTCCDLSHFKWREGEKGVLITNNALNAEINAEVKPRNSLIFEMASVYSEPKGSSVNGLSQNRSTDNMQPRNTHLCKKSLPLSLKSDTCISV